MAVLHGVVVGQIRHERIHAQRIPFGPDLALSRDVHLAALARDQIRPRVGARHTGQQRWRRQPDPVVAITCGMRYRTRGHDLVRQRHARPVARQNIVFLPLLSCRGGGRFPHMYRIRGRFRRILSTEAGAIGIRRGGVALWLRLQLWLCLRLWLQLRWRLRLRGCLRLGYIADGPWRGCGRHLILGCHNGCASPICRGLDRRRR